MEGGLEREESDIVKETEQREDSSLKRGTSKISRALVCHFMSSELCFYLNISGHTEAIQRRKGTLQGKKVNDLTVIF